MSQNIKPDTSRIIEDYVSGLTFCLHELVGQDITGIADLIFAAYLQNKQIFIMGNGGSASTASHFTCDLRKKAVVAGKPRMRAISLADNMALVSAVANDIDYESVFAEQLADLLNPGDVVIAMSVSGNSPNVLRGTEFARNKGAITIGLCGFGGGRLAAIAEKCIVLTGTDYGQVEDTYISLGHILSYMVRERIING